MDKVLKNFETRIAAVAKAHADDVDANGRFPHEAVEVMRETGAFIWPIPKQYGGMGATVYDLAQACKAIGQYCSAAAAVLSMHYTQILSVIHHHQNNPQLIAYMQRVAKENRLIASVTSEVGPGGNMRNSACAVEMKDGQFTLTKQATTISYGEHADDLMITARKDHDAAAGDQVLVIAEKGHFTLDNIGEWDTLGMRGTCSPPATVSAHGDAWQVIPAPFADIATHTMVPTSHILWSAWWYGLATGATQKARELLRAKARSNPGTNPLGAHRVAELDAQLQSMGYEVMWMAREYAEAVSDNSLAPLTTEIGYGLNINALKLNSSNNVVKIVGEALAICGIQAYKNKGPFSLGRQLRDAYSSIMMIHNDRITQTNASNLTIYKGV